MKIEMKGIVIWDFWGIEFLRQNFMKPRLALYYNDLKLLLCDILLRYQLCATMPSSFLHLL